MRCVIMDPCLGLWCQPLGKNSINNNWLVTLIETCFDSFSFELAMAVKMFLILFSLYDTQ